ncbi:MAG: glycosyltransferase family 4 protein [Chloroflexi bacterium]|nr:glycosyltransferase family 4 protein [Chloroflexota bacterium]
MSKNEQCVLIKGIKYVSYYDSGGYFNAAKNYMLGLVNQGIPLTWAPIQDRLSGDMRWSLITKTKVGDPQLDPYLNRSIEYDTVILHLGPSKYPWWIEKELDKKIIGYTVWETDRIPPFWVGPINMLHRVIVPTEWNKKVFQQGGITIPINVVPHMVNPRFTDKAESAKLKPEKEYTFYFIGTWSERKAIPMLLKAYWETFSADDPTNLVIKTTSLDWTKSIRPHVLEKILLRTKIRVALLKRGYKSPAKVQVISNEIGEDEIYMLHQTSDCYISLCRSEGWGLGAFDAASLGKPVIMTGFGGQLDYLPDDLSYLVDYDLIPVQTKWRGENFAPGQRWANPDLKHASRLMKKVFNDQERAAKKGAELQKTVLLNFSKKTVMEKLLAVIDKTRLDG